MTRAIVTTGSASEVSASAGSAQSSRGNPPAGSTPRRSENTRDQQHADPEDRHRDAELREPAEQRAVPACPAGRRRRNRPARRPRPPGGTTSSVSGTVTARRAAISGPTGSVLTNDVPRSQRRPAAPSQETNCSGSGWSDPTWCRAAAICSGVAPDRQQRVGGVAGQQPQQEEQHDHGDQEQRDDEEGRAAQQVGT